MVFSEGVFLTLFLPITLFGYYVLFSRSMRVRNRWLLFVSIGFYAWGEPVYVLLMLASIVVNWLFGRAVSKCPRTLRGRRIVALACCFDLGLLFVFKYAGWLLPGSPFSGLALPIGISFYTFQALSYVIDVYRGQEKAQESVLDVGLYIAFFPQLIAGPIVRYGDVSEQIHEREHGFGKFCVGVRRFVIGLSKKLLIANQVGVVSSIALRARGGDLSVLLAWIGALAMWIQIYFDFSGYSDMAIGLGKMFGFDFRENFDYPYMSRSVSEFWRRWHISLGAWFRDYLYYPIALGPSIRIRKALGKCLDWKTAGRIAGWFPLLAVWMATGVWHGAGWTYVTWGLALFLTVVYEDVRKPFRNERLESAAGRVRVILVTMLLLVVFESDSLGHAAQYYLSMFHLNGNALSDAYGTYWVYNFRMFLLAGLVLCFPVLERVGGFLENHGYGKTWHAIQAASMVGLLWLDFCYAIGSSYNPFIYFNF